MNIRDRADLFSRLIGYELKGRIVTRGFTAKAVAERARRSPSALSNWLNGHVGLPLTALFETCEIIGIAPSEVIDAAYDRLRAELGDVTAPTRPHTGTDRASTFLPSNARRDDEAAPKE